MICRDVEWWDRIANHPEVAPHVFLGLEPVSLAPLVEDERAKPFASEHGGVIFSPLDKLGMVYEMHTLFEPEGWGREVAINGKLFVEETFKDASIVVTHEQEGNWRSKPPRSHGWICGGDYCYVGLPVRLRLWVLTKEAWLSSPARRKMKCQ
jgi:hypothetical protein